MPFSVEGQVTYEFSSNYFHKPQVYSKAKNINTKGTRTFIVFSLLSLLQIADRLRKYNPSMKLIVVLCDPVRRLVSEYLDDKYQGRFCMFIVMESGCYQLRSNLCAENTQIETQLGTENLRDPSII